MRILIIDDDIAQVESLTLILNQFNHTIYSALLLDAAKIVAQTHKPEVVILDLMMPKGSKIFLDWIANDPDMKDVKVIIVTGMPVDDELKSRFNLPENIPIIEKPYNINTLLQAIGGL